MKSPKLSVESGPGKGRSVELDGEVVVGREGADLTIEDSEPPRRHVAFRPVNGGVEIEDLGSTNGTFVDGHRINGPARVTKTATISVGQSRLSVELPVADVGATARRAAPVASPMDVTRARETVEPPSAPERTARRRKPAKAPPTEPVDAETAEPAAKEPRKRGGPPLFEERSDFGKLLFVALGPAAAGLGSAILLGISGPIFLLSAIVGLAASFMGGQEHRDIGHAGRCAGSWVASASPRPSCWSTSSSATTRRPSCRNRSASSWPSRPLPRWRSAQAERSCAPAATVRPSPTDATSASSSSL